MSVATVERVRGRGVEALPILAWVGAIAFAVAGVWFALVEYRVTVAEPPNIGGMPVEAAARAWWGDWFVTTLSQERLYVGLACIGFACIAIVGMSVQDRLGNDLGRAGMWMASFGSIAWIVGNVLQLGGHRAVGLMATHAGNPIDVTNSIAFTVDMIVDALEVTAFAFVGAGLVALGLAALRVDAERWGWGSVIAGGLSGGIAVSYIAGSDVVVDVLLVVAAVVMFPLWLIAATRAAFLKEG